MSLVFLAARKTRLRSVLRHINNSSYCVNTVNHPKLGGNSAFSQNFHTRKLGDITVFDTVSVSYKNIKT